MATTYLNRTLGTPTNNKIWTWSSWIKKSKNGDSYPNIFGAQSGGLRDCIRFTDTDALQIIFNEAGSGIITSTQLLRDLSEIGRAHV